MRREVELSATFYCDESGYTGADWANPEQTIFVHGGWLLLNSEKDAVTAGIDEIRERHRLSGTELKWRQLARKPDPAAVFRDFVRLMLENRGLPFFQVADKDYMIAAKAIETYFDPAYNHQLPMSFTADFNTKKQLVEALLDASAVLARFADILRQGEEPPAVVVRRIGSEMAGHFTDVGEEDAAAVLSDFSDEEVGDIQSEFVVDSWRRSTTAHTFWAVLQHLEGFSRAHGLEVEILHDNIVRFDELLDLVRGIFRPSDSDDLTVIGGRIFFLSMSTMTSLELADSKDEPLIQLADLLCGFVRTLFTKLKLQGLVLSPAEKELAFDLAMIQEQLETWDSNVPESLLMEFARAAFVNRLGADED